MEKRTTEAETVPRVVQLSVNQDALEKNLDHEGSHHVFGDDGTHVVITDSGGKPSDAECQPMFRIVDEARDETLLQKIWSVFE